METAKCKKCGKKIRAQRLNRPHFSGLCRKCWRKYGTIKGEKHWSFTGGRYKRKTREDYWMININIIKDEKLKKMAKQTIQNRCWGKKRSGTIYEHILVMIKKLGRPLKKGEEVHHLDGNKENNNLNNLILIDRKNHIQKYWNLIKENEELKREIQRLKSQ